MKVDTNGKTYDYKENYQGAVTDLLYFQSKHFPYQSCECIVENLTNLMNDFIEVLGWEKENIKGKDDIVYQNMRKSITSMVKKVKSFNKYIIYKKSRTALQSYIYDFVLGLEGTGLLHGYGFGNKFGDRLKGNSEKVSCTGKALFKE